MFHLVSPSSAKEKDAHADLQKPLFMASISDTLLIDLHTALYRANHFL